MRKKMVAFLLTMVFLFSFAVAEEPAELSETTEPAEGEVVPACEVKLLLSSDLVLDENHLLREEFIEMLQLDGDCQGIETAYLDTADRDYDEAGWVNRLRLKEPKKKKEEKEKKEKKKDRKEDKKEKDEEEKKEKKKNYKITYKKRYSVTDGDLDAAFALAADDGFTLEDPEFSAEIDWGYSGMTLSFSLDVDIDLEEDAEFALPQGRDAAEIVAENMPEREKQWAGGNVAGKIADALEVTRPARAKRYSGVEDDNIRVEVWEIRVHGETRYVTEYSIACDSVEEAAGLRDQAMERLDALGILQRKSELKTEMILEGAE